MSRYLFHGLKRSLKTIQFQRLLFGEYTSKHNTILFNNKYIRFASTTVDPSALTEENKAVEKKEVDKDFTTLWKVERLVSASMVILVPAAFACPCPALDGIMAFTFVMHSFWGLEAVCADYINASTCGTVIPKLAMILVVILSIVTLVGLFRFIQQDVGVAQCFHCLWTVGDEFIEEEIDPETGKAVVITRPKDEIQAQPQKGGKETQPKKLDKKPESPPPKKGDNPKDQKEPKKV